MLVEARVACPHCGEPVSLPVDTTAGTRQRYYEDCAVCCRPMAVRIECEPGELRSVAVAPA